MTEYFFRTGFRIEVISWSRWRKVRTIQSAVALYFERLRDMRGATMRVRGQA